MGIDAMAMNEETKAAAAAIGGGAQRDDWRLLPETHAAAMTAEAGALKRVLGRETFESRVDDFNKNDALAVAAQTRFRFYAEWSAFFSLVAIISASALLVAFGFAPNMDHRIVQALSYLTSIAIVLSFALSLLEGRLKPFPIWMQTRAAAENARLRLFSEVAAAKEPVRDDELPLTRLQLEYFVRYQLEVQRRYYRERGAEHQGAVNRAYRLRLAAFALLIVAITPQIAATLGQQWESWPGFAWLLGGATLEPDLEARVFAGLSAVGAALQGWLAAHHLIAQDVRNAARYAATLENLDALAERPLDEAREGALRGDREAVLGFVALVQEQISSEHREWISLRLVSPELSLARLKELSLPRLS